MSRVSLGLIRHAGRIQGCCEQLEDLLGREQWQEASVIAMKLKYWQSIVDAIKEWKPAQT